MPKDIIKRNFDEVISQYINGLKSIEKSDCNAKIENCSGKIEQSLHAGSEMDIISSLKNSKNIYEVAIVKGSITLGGYRGALKDLEYLVKVLNKENKGMAELDSTNNNQQKPKEDIVILGRSLKPKRLDKSSPAEVKEGIVILGRGIPKSQQKEIAKNHMKNPNKGSNKDPENSI